MNSSEMNKVSPAPSNASRPILKRRSLLTQKNADSRQDKKSYMHLSEGSRTEEQEESYDSSSQSFCKIGGDSGGPEHAEVKCKKAVHFATGTEFYERNMNSNFWRNIEKRRRYYNYSVRNVDSLAHLRRRRAHFHFSPHLQNPIRGQGETFYSERNSAHYYYYRTNNNNNTIVPSPPKLQGNIDNNNVCCLDSLSRRLRNLVCCISGAEEEDSSDCDMVISPVDSCPSNSDKSRSI